jgi:hypothetical protein
MTFRSSIRFTITAAALAGVLVVAPAASASPAGDGFVPRRSAPNGIDPHGRQARYAQQVAMPAKGEAITNTVPSVPDRTDGLGTSRGPVASTSSEPSVPDRSDGLGTSRGPQVVQLPMAADSNGGFSWTDGIITVAFLLGASLLAAFAVMSVRGRGRGGLAMPS